MKKLLLILTVFAAFTVNAQISFNNVLTTGYYPKAIGNTKIGNSRSYESGNLLYTPSTNVRSTSTFTNTPSFQVSDSLNNTTLFKVLNSGAIYSGTIQGVSTSTFVAGSNTITVTNGLITRVQ